jgi:hypothetical protein
VDSAGLPGKKDKLKLNLKMVLGDSVLLFYPRHMQELMVLGYLRTRRLIENCYRFGGIGNYCARIAEGREQLMLHNAAKAWDFSAVLLPFCAGYAVVTDPASAACPLESYVPQAKNTFIIAPPAVMPEFLAHVKAGWPK